MHSGQRSSPEHHCEGIRRLPGGFRIIPEGIPEAFPVSLSLSSPLAEGVVMVARG